MEEPIPIIDIDNSSRSVISIHDKSDPHINIYEISSSSKGDEHSNTVISLTENDQDCTHDKDFDFSENWICFDKLNLSKVEIMCLNNMLMEKGLWLLPSKDIKVEEKNGTDFYHVFLINLM